jgi:hypothetical protein
VLLRSAAAGVPGREQGLGGGGRDGLWFLPVEVARCSVGEEHVSGLAPGFGRQSFAFADEVVVGASGVAEVEEGLAGVHREICFGHPGAPGGPVSAGVVEVYFRCGEGAPHGASVVSVASCGEGAGEA